MKKNILLSVLLLWVGIAWADFQRDVPQSLKQADGTTFHCYASGDEFYNWLHDEAGYTIVLADDGYYYYAKKNSKGILVSTDYRADKGLPANSGLQPYLRISEEAYQAKRKQRLGDGPQASLNVKSLDRINGITIYIQFADDEAFTSVNMTKHHETFTKETGPSLRHYYNKVSYGNLDLRVLHIPANENPNVAPVAYIDSKGRNYYRPFNATTNTIGYSGDNERASREKTLLKNALLWVKDNHPIPADYRLDSDGDGYCDLVSFVIRGNSDGWNDLLWAHKWQLESQYQVELQPGAKVSVYTFQNENQCIVRTLCHETFHAFGAPDLYHYNENFNRLAPMGYWDIMESSGGHMSAYMKAYYTNWINGNFPVISKNGRYVLYPHAKQNDRCVYRINGEAGNDFYLMEYRNRKIDIYEGTIPGDGLLVTRVYVPRQGRGNAEYNGLTIFDELYALRPNGTTTTNGNIGLANHSKQENRPALGPMETTTFYDVRGNQRAIQIYDIDDRGDSILFSVFLGENFQAEALQTRLFADTLGVSWTPNASTSDVVLLVDTVEYAEILDASKTYTQGEILSGGAKVLYVGSDKLFLFHEGFDKNKTYYFQLFHSKEGRYSTPRIAKYEYTLPTKGSDTLSNIVAGQGLAVYSWRDTWGTISGHNGFNDKIFVEKHSISELGNISGLIMRVGNIKALNGANSKIQLKVYTGTENQVGEELYSQDYSFDGLSSGVRYFPFHEKVPVNGVFFVGFQVEYKTPCDTFFVYTTQMGSGNISSFFACDYQNVFSSVSEILSGKISLCVQPIIERGTTLLLNPSAYVVTESLNAEHRLQLTTNLTDYKVETTAPWITVASNPYLSLIDVKVAHDRSLEGEQGEIRVINGQDTARCVITISTATGFRVEISDNLLQIYPNPSSSGIFTVDGLGKAKEIRIYDLSGRCLEIRRIEGNQEVVDLSKYAQGIYFLHTDISPKAYKLIRP